MAMSPKPRIDICEAFRLHKPIVDALQQVPRLAVRHHQMTGIPLVEWRDGKVVHTDPFTGEIVPPPDPAKEFTPLPY